MLESCKYALGLDETILQTDTFGKILSYCFIASTGFMERHKQIGKNLAEGVTRREEFG